ncbi:MAG: GNAT family N-acetyltransferase [Burkholderiales bacterium]|nr:GNAT family N-acetyltransferase [Burkholderiales bacterium]
MQHVHTLDARSRRAVARHLLALPAADRHLRFGAALTDRVIAEHVRMLDFRADRVLAARGPRGRILGLAHVAVAGATADVGLSVAADARGRGLGTSLFAAATTAARAAGCTRVAMHYLAWNHAVQRIAQRAGMRIVQDAGSADAYLDIGATAGTARGPADALPSAAAARAGGAAAGGPRCLGQAEKTGYNSNLAGA